MKSSSFTPAQERHFFTLCQQNGVTKDDLQELYKTGVFAEILKTKALLREWPDLFKMLPGAIKQLMKAALWDSIPEYHRFSRNLGLTWTNWEHPLSQYEHELVVDYSMSFRELAGATTDFLPEASENTFPIIGEGVHKLRPHLVCFKHRIPRPRALRGLDVRGLRPANTAETLAFARQFYWIATDLPRFVIALGSSGVATKTGPGRKELQLNPWGGKDRYRVEAYWYREIQSDHYLLAFRK